MRKFVLSTLWTISVVVNSGSTNVNVSMPDQSFDSLLNTIQALSSNSSLFSSNFLDFLFKLF
jgi:hypothetical protein